MLLINATDCQKNLINKIISCKNTFSLWIYIMKFLELFTIISSIVDDIFKCLLILVKRWISNKLLQ